MDIKRAFLNGFIKEKVYAEQPLGFKSFDFSNNVFSLSKVLYRLKQAPRAWFARLTACLHSLNFISSKADSSLFILKQAHHFVFLLVYVDDIVITGSCPKLIQSIIDAIQQTFPIRDLGSLHYFLGMEFKAQSYGNLLTQSRYLHDLLHKHGMVDCKPCQTPMQSSSTL